ncbi:MAG: pilus (MSHA type) biogenesis protein MshL [Gammaproteobacteria bacterium]|nr:pilus (MSHA type) biogenesis protein MshL [Gammaproteobacteria bacterium]
MFVTTNIAKICITLLTLLIAACETMPINSRQKTLVLKNSDEISLFSGSVLGASNDVSTLPDKLIPMPVEEAISAALMPLLDVQVSAAQKRLMETRFDLYVNSVPAKTVFMSLVKDTPFNMVVHPDVSSLISLDLKNVTVDEVMNVIRNVYGIEYRFSPFGYEVLADIVQSRLFSINYLNVRRRGSSQIRVSSGQLSEAGNKKKPPGNSGENTGNATQSTSVSGSKVDTFSDADFWLELKLALKSIVGELDGRNVVVNPQSGVVVVRALPAELRQVQDYLTVTQNIITRQVILEAKILEIELSDRYQAGVNWAALFSNNGRTMILGQTGGGTIFNGNGLSGIADTTGTLDPLNYSQVQGTATSAFGGVFSAALNLKNFTAFIEALETQGDVHVLSSPRISTVNNQKAVIKVGSDEFFVTDITTEISNNGTSSNQSINVELTPFFSGVALDVLPQIDGQGEVTLYVHPSVSDVKEKVKQIDLSRDESINIPLALSTIRESDSIVKARSGQVVVIGGLMQNITRDNTASVPFLGKVPIIGGLFRHEQKTIRKSELVILLRPVVIENGKAWIDIVGQHKLSLQKLSNQYGIVR